MSDAAAEEVLEEAAEAFAIERTKQEIGYQVPSFEEVARALDPIGVMDVIDAFNLGSCDDTKIADFPTCPGPGHWIIGFGELGAMNAAEEVSSFQLKCFIHSVVYDLTMTQFGVLLRWL